MKTIFFKTLALVFLSLSIGCSDDDEETTTSNNNLQGSVLTGTITTNLNVPAGNYTLKGTVTVRNNATLTIQPGAKFTVTQADQNAGTNYLLVETGSKLIANGTSTSPIVFTAASEQIGAWGGIILNGLARINATGGSEIAEAGGKTYGGTNDADNSGSLKYVRVEFAGSAVTGGTAEYNAFSFFGCGTGTTLENLQAYKGADDGFEFFGGSVNATNIAAFGCEDDSIDWDKGYRGTLTNVWVKQPSNGDWGFETSNHPTEFNNSPRSMPTVNNVTVVGNGNSGKAAFLFKEGTAGIINNVKVSNCGHVVRLNTQLNEYNNNTLKVNNVNATNILTSNVKNGVNSDNIDNIMTASATAVGANEAAFTTWIRN